MGSSQFCCLATSTGKLVAMLSPLSIYDIAPEAWRKGISKLRQQTLLTIQQR